MGQFDDAKECFDKAVHLDKKQTISYAWLADSYKELGNFEDAQKNYKKAYELSEQDDYKKSAEAMEEKIHPGKKKGFFSRIFG